MNVTAKYTSPTHSLNVAHPVNTSADSSRKASLEGLRQAILDTQADLNAFLTERKHDEDRANGVTSNQPEDNGDDEENDDEEGKDGEEWINAKEMVW